MVTLRQIKDSLTIVFTEMAPSFFFEVTNINYRISLGALSDSVVLCVSAIGSADAFVQTMQKVTVLFMFIFSLYTFLFSILLTPIL